MYKEVLRDAKWHSPSYPRLTRVIFTLGRVSKMWQQLLSQLNVTTKCRYKLSQLIAITNQNKKASFHIFIYIYISHGHTVSMYIICRLLCCDEWFGRKMWWLVKIFKLLTPTELSPYFFKIGSICILFSFQENFLLLSLWLFLAVKEDISWHMIYFTLKQCGLRAGNWMNYPFPLSDNRRFYKLFTVQ